MPNSKSSSIKEKLQKLRDNQTKATRFAKGVFTSQELKDADLSVLREALAIKYPDETILHEIWSRDLYG